MGSRRLATSWVNRSEPRWRGRLGAAWVLFGLFVSIAASDGDERGKPSGYAPAEPLAQYVQRETSRIGNDLSDKEDYGEEQQERVVMRANAVLAAAMVLGNHDQSHPLRTQAAKLVELAQQLAESADDFDAARAAFEKLQEATKASASSKAPQAIGWEARADIAELMKAVPIVNNSLRRGVTSRRFQRTAKRTAMYAAALAAIAQASSLDDTYCDDDESLAKWKKLCYEMRDGAAAARKAVDAGDQAAAKKAIERIVKTCDACHEDFR